MMLPRAAAVALLAAALVATALPVGSAGVAGVVVGTGTATYTNYALGLVCPNFAFVIEMLIVESTAVVQMQAVHPDPQCTMMAQFYSINPVVVEGDWEQGWEGEAVGVGIIWPEWPVTIGGKDYASDGIPLYSYYVDENGRAHLFEGSFQLVATL